MDGNVEGTTGQEMMNLDEVETDSQVSELKEEGEARSPRSKRYASELSDFEPASELEISPTKKFYSAEFGEMCNIQVSPMMSPEKEKPAQEMEFSFLPPAPPCSPMLAQPAQEAQIKQLQDHVLSLESLKNRLEREVCSNFSKYELIAVLAVF